MPLNAFNVLAREAAIVLKDVSFGSTVTSTEAKQDAQITEIQSILAKITAIDALVGSYENVIYDVIYTNGIVPTPNWCIAFEANALDEQDIVVDAVNIPHYAPISIVANSDSNYITSKNIDFNGGAGIFVFKRKIPTGYPPLISSGIFATSGVTTTLRLQMAVDADVVINWGDGSEETFSLLAGVFQDCSHVYASAGNYFVDMFSDNGDDLDFIINLTNGPIWQKVYADMSAGARLSWSNNQFFDEIQIPDVVNLDTFFIGGTTLNALATGNAAPNLRILSVNGANLGSKNPVLDLVGRLALQTIQVQNGQFSEIDFNGSTNLLYFIASNNALNMTLNFTGYNLVQWIYINGNESQDNLTGISGKSSLTRVVANSCDLANVSPSSCPNLETLVLNSNPNLSTVNVTGCSSLVTFDVSSCPLISTSGIGLNSSLEYELVDFRDCGLSDAQMAFILDELVINIGSYTKVGRQLLLEGNNVPGASNLTKINSLVADGWTVTYEVI